MALDPTAPTSPDSTAPGYLTQVSTNALGDDELTDIFQGLAVGLTGLDPTLVRPRWQPQPPTQPPPTTNWCAIGVTKYSSVDYPQKVHLSPEPGQDQLYRSERLDVIATFYGPNSASNATLFRDGLYIDQNYQTLAGFGVKLRSADEIVHLPELVNSQYISRSDVPASFMRMIQRTYAVRNILGAVVTIVTNNGDGCTEIISQ